MATAPIQEEIVLNDGELICALTGSKKKATEKEQVLQSIIRQMNEEYSFELADMQRDFKIPYEDENGKKRSLTVDLAVFEEGKAHDRDNLIRVCYTYEGKVSDSDKKKGVVATLHNTLELADCEFGLWTNGAVLQYAQMTEDNVGNILIEEISDFPGNGESIDDMISLGGRAKPRKPANDSLVRTFARCHDYLYGNEGRKKDAFWELLYLIFCKIYDEKRRFLCAERNQTYIRQFWVGVKEKNTPEGQKLVAKRIKGIFEELKGDNLFNEVFDEKDAITISDRAIAYIASEISKYSFLDATVDVKGTAYETIVSNTLKQSAGQFFTPRNIIKCMVEMMNPTENTRVLDPACGSGGFLVVVLDYVRKQITKQMYPELEGVLLESKTNSEEVNERVRKYAEKMIFGFDFDPDLRKAARMNMVMSGDGHANIYNVNSLDYPDGDLPDVEKIAPAVMKSINNSYDKDFKFETAPNNALGKFDMIFTNPPFGTKVEVDPSISVKYELNSKAPEVLFIEQCYNFLKPGGKMAIVLPDGILGNPNTESVRIWILQHFHLLASIDLPVETFLPQVGVQASLLFLQKKTALEEMQDYQEEDYPVFMAIAEMVGKDRRGVPVYERDDDGAELLFKEKVEWLGYNRFGEPVAKSRIESVKHRDDDLPKISKAYKKFLEENK